MKSSNIITLTVCFLALPFLSTRGVSQQQQAVPFGCDARGSDRCYFSLFYGSGGIRNFVMRAGERDHIPGVVVGRDTYCVAINQVPSAACSRRKVNASYNN